jgi:peptidoglycan/LPS O-acetylase OafA/YrhL
MDLKKKRNYIPEIDGLRAIAVISVILFHADFEIFKINFKGGYLGVDIFFVISGYLITKLIILEQKSQQFSFSNFYLRRARRILPALLLVAVISYPFALFFFLPSPFLEYIGSLISGIFFSSNFFFYLSEIDYYALPSTYKPLLHYWSLSVEEQFYFVYPISLYLIYKYFKNKLEVSFILIGFLSFFFSIYLNYNDKSLSFYLFPTRIWEFLFGALAAKFHLKNIEVRNQKIKIFAQLFGFLFILISILLLKENTTEDNNLVNTFLFSHPGLKTLLPVIGTFLVILFTNDRNILNSILSFKPIVFVGLISYSLYLWHYPIFSFIKLSSIDINSIHEYLILIFFIVFVSIISYYFVEQPFRNKKLISTKYLFIYLSLIFLIISLLCFHAVKNKGYSSVVPEYFKEFKISDKMNNFLFNQREIKKKTNNKKLNFKANISNLETYLVIGDSHMGSFMNLIKTELDSKNIDLISLTYLNIFTLDFINVDRRNGEMINLQYKLNSILKEKNISTIILISRFPLYWHRTGFDNLQGADGKEIVKFLPYFLDNKKKRLNQKNRKKIISNSFNESVKKILDKNINVIIFYPIPEPGYSVPNVVASRILPRLKMKSLFGKFISNKNLFQLPEEKYVTTSYDLYLERNEEVFNMLDEIKHPNLYRVYPHQKLCNFQIENKCVTHSENNIYYFDDNHLSEHGAKLIMPQFIDVLNRTK